MRVKLVFLGYRFFYEALGLLQGINKIKVNNPLPKDAKILRFDVVPAHAVIAVLVESESFEEVNDCQEIPVYQFEFVIEPMKPRKRRRFNLER